MALKMPGDLCMCRPWDVQPDCCCDDWPSPWPIPPDTPPEELTPLQRKALWAQAAASEKLHRLTAFRWGLCEDLVRPCGPMDCAPKVRGVFTPPYGYGPGYAGLFPGSGLPVPYVENGSMYNSVCGCACACDIRCTIPLPGPVNEVLEVTLDGQRLEEGVDWFVTGEGGLARLNGCWPHSQDMTLPCGVEGSFCVRYLRGINPDADLGAIQAVSMLACKLFHDACGDGDCPSLQGATRITRGNVSWERSQEQADRYTGVSAVDDWLDMVNPYGHRQVPRVYSLDTRRWKFRGVSEFRRSQLAGGGV